MRRLKKLCALLLCACLLAALTGCGAREQAEEPEALNLYASFYPVYAIASAIVDGAPDLQLHQLVQPQDGCLRAYALSDWDAALLGSADAVFIAGGGLESFSGALTALGEDRFAVVGLLYNVELLQTDAENADAEAHPHWLDANPHAYLSVDGGREMAGRAAQSMALLDPRYEDLYLENLARTEARFDELRADIEAETAGLAGVRAAVLNEALLYPARDYGLDAALCWPRESGEDMDEGELEALLAALDERDIHLVLIERQAPQRLLAALEGAGVAVARLDVLSTHRADEGCDAYFDALRENAAIARAAYEHIPQEEE